MLPRGGGTKKCAPHTQMVLYAPASRKLKTKIFKNSFLRRYLLRIPTKFMHVHNVQCLYNVHCKLRTCIISIKVCILNMRGMGVFVYICLQACDFYQNNNKDCNKRRILSWGGRLKGWGCEIVF